jgi:hypothetical protein
MIDKALIIIIFCYAAGFVTVAVQIELETHDIIITNLDGTPIESNIIGFLNIDQYNQVTSDIVNGTFNENTTYYNKVETFTTAAASVAWNLILLLSGTYIFNFIFIIGVPAHFVAVFVVVYLLLLSRAVIGYVRGL